MFVKLTLKFIFLEILTEFYVVIQQKYLPDIRLNQYLGQPYS